MATTDQSQRWILITGTTVIILVKNETHGIFVCTDGLETQLVFHDSDPGAQQQHPPVPISNSNKAIKISEDVYATVAGCSGWFDPVISKLTTMDQTQELLTAEDCAQEAEEFFGNKNYKLEKLDIQKKAASICFSEYSGSNRVIYVGRLGTGDVFRKEVFTRSEIRERNTNGKEIDGNSLRTFCFQGSGAKYARRALIPLRSKLESGDDDEQTIAKHILLGMALACQRDLKTGGTVKVILLNDDGVEELEEIEAEVLMQESKVFLDKMKRIEDVKEKCIEKMKKILKVVNRKRKREAKAKAKKAVEITMEE